MIELDHLERVLGHDPRYSDHFSEILPDALVSINMIYATTQNFMNENIYRSFQKAWLHRQAYEKFMRAKELLKAKNSGYRFLIYDALRPWRFQVRMFSRVKDTAHESYIANPVQGSLHNFGMAIDLTLINSSNEPLDMGSEFDEFSEVSQPQFESKLIQAGRITQKQLDHRMLLREIMVHAGFASIPNEWWHFNSCNLEEAKLLAPRID